MKDHQLGYMLPALPLGAARKASTLASNPAWRSTMDALSFEQGDWLTAEMAAENEKDAAAMADVNRAVLLQRNAIANQFAAPPMQGWRVASELRSVEELAIVQVKYRDGQIGYPVQSHHIKRFADLAISFRTSNFVDPVLGAP